MCSVGGAMVFKNAPATTYHLETVTVNVVAIRLPFVMAPKFPFHTLIVRITAMHSDDIAYARHHIIPRLPHLRHLVYDFDIPESHYCPLIETLSVLWYLVKRDLPELETIVLRGSEYYPENGFEDDTFVSAPGDHYPEYTWTIFDRRGIKIYHHDAVQ